MIKSYKCLSIILLAVLLLHQTVTGQQQENAPQYPSKKTVKDYPHTGEPAMPPVVSVLDEPLRDVSVCKGGDSAYYLTGTLGPNFMIDNEGIKVWRSTDLKNWQPLGLVWSIERDGTWQKEWTVKNGQRRRALWAPEIHYLKGNYYIAYCITGLGTGLLCSVSGKPEGPYAAANKPDAPLTTGIDASLFQDDDGTIYFLSGSGMISKMNDDMTALVTKPVRLTCVPDSNIDHHHPSRPCTQLDHVGFEGVYMFKANGRYYLSCAERYYERYHCMTAEATNIMGPYSARYVSVPYAGHNTFFQDDKGNWWSTLFGNDADAPLDKHAGLVAITFDKDGHIKPKTN